MKKMALLVLFLCLRVSSVGLANTDMENWCGTYFEEDGRGFIRLAREDIQKGSDNCSIEAYTDRIEKTGQAKIGLEFTRNRSTVMKWRKFTNHLIEIRGKMYNGNIISTRFIRDIGI